MLKKLIIVHLKMKSLLYIYS